MFDDEEKSLPPTVLGLEQARRRGQVARSGELTFAAMLLGAWAILNWSLPRLAAKSLAMVGVLLDIRWEARQPMLAGVWPAVAPVAMEVGLLLAGAVGLAILVNVLQVGLLAAGEAVGPDLSRISPTHGLRRILSLRSAQRVAMAMAKLALVGWIALAGIGPDMGRISRAARQSIQDLLQCGGELAGGVLLKAGLAMLVLGVIDYIYQRWQHHRDLRISPRQMRQELKQIEGDAVHKRMRQRQARQILSQQIQVEVPRAAVLIANDRGLVLAIRFELSMRQPQVAAKATGPLGKRMMRMAAGAGVCLVEDADLARALYRRCPVRAAVPRRYMDRVAEIVAYARQVRSRAASCGREGSSVAQAVRV